MAFAKSLDTDLKHRDNARSFNRSICISLSFTISSSVFNSKHRHELVYIRLVKGETGCVLSWNRTETKIENEQKKGPANMCFSEIKHINMKQPEVQNYSCSSCSVQKWPAAGKTWA